MKGRGFLAALVLVACGGRAPAVPQPPVDEGAELLGRLGPRFVVVRCSAHPDGHLDACAAERRGPAADDAAVEAAIKAAEVTHYPPESAPRAVTTVRLRLAPQAAKTSHSLPSFDAVRPHDRVYRCIVGEDGAYRDCVLAVRGARVTPDDLERDPELLRKERAPVLPRAPGQVQVHHVHIRSF